MGPQPIGERKTVPPEMWQAAERIVNALMRADKVAALAITAPQAREQVERIAASIEPGAYNKSEFIGHARVVRHYFVKARFTGTAPAATMQVRIGPEEDGRWTVREAVNLTGLRSGWTK